MGGTPQRSVKAVKTPNKMSLTIQVATICGKVAPVASMIVFTAPMPTITQIIRDKAVGNLPLLPYSSMVSSAFLWTVYGILKHDPNIWLTNLIGLVFALYYFTSFAKYAPKSSPTLPGTVRQHWQGIYCIVFVASLLFLSGLPWAVNVVGTSAVILCIAMFASPLTALKVVLQTKSAKAIPLPFTVASLVNCFTWTVYGIVIVSDPNIYLTNALGLTFAVTQLALKVLYDYRNPQSLITSESLLPK